MLNLRKSMPALALAGAMVVAAAGAASAAAHWEGGHGGHMGGHSGGHMGGNFYGHNGGHDGGHGGHFHHGHHHGPFITFYGDPFYSYDDYGYGNDCGYYRVKWHNTGRHYWLDRYEECLEG